MVNKYDEKMWNYDPFAFNVKILIIEKRICRVNQI